MNASQRLEISAIIDGVQTGAACRAIAERVFPHNHDRDKCDRLTEELVEFLSPLVNRIAALERHSRPPAALPIEEMQREIADLKDRMAVAEAPIRVTVRPRR